MKVSNNTVTVLALEDDTLQAEGLQLLLEELGYHFRITDNGVDGLKYFKQMQPDLLLVDIAIHGPLSGIEFVELASAIRKTPVIFITAFSDQETFQKAKQTLPSAYLLKPYNARNLQLAIELALFQQQEATGSSYPVAVNGHESFFVKYNNRLVKVPVTDIVFIEVEEKYCYLNTGDRRYAVNIRLKNLLDLLPHDSFVQTHRSFAVKVSAIDEVNLDDNLLKVKQKQVPIGKRYKESLFSKLRTF